MYDKNWVLLKFKCQGTMERPLTKVYKINPHICICVYRSFIHFSVCTLYTYL